MKELSILDDTRFLIALIGVGWSALLALLRRAIASVEEKLDGAARRSQELSLRLDDLRDRLDEANSHARSQMERAAGRLSESALDTERKMNEKMEALRSQAVSRHEFNLLAGNLQSMLEAVYNYVISHGVRD
jgi:F0F1-type ATP synthase membrane subunit b/b'